MAGKRNCKRGFHIHRPGHKSRILNLQTRNSGKFHYAEIKSGRNTIFKQIKEASEIKYYVTFAIDARCITEVNADSIEKAKELAMQKYMCANLGELSEVIDSKPVTIEDEKGDFVWTK